MIENALETAFCTALKADCQLSSIHFFTALDGEKHQLPAVTVIAKSEPLAASAEVFRADVEIRIESHAKDITPEEHAAVVGKIRSLLASKTSMIAALNAGDAVQVFGYATTGSGQEADAEIFQTTITLKAGCRTTAN